MAKVIVIGGGVGGLTAAHELVERGLEVHVYEARATWGGKARTQPVPGTGTGGRRDLPGEHGFRFFQRACGLSRQRLLSDAQVLRKAGKRAPQEGDVVADVLHGRVDLMGHARRKLTDALELLRQAQLFFQAFARGDFSL